MQEAVRPTEDDLPALPRQQEESSRRRYVGFLALVVGIWTLVWLGLYLAAV